MKTGDISPHVKDVLKLLGAGVLLSSLFLFPGAAAGVGMILREYKKMRRERDFAEWEKYNLSRLRYMLKRLHKQKLVRISRRNGQDVVELTRKGKMKRLAYNLEAMSIERPDRWDGRWRVIIYDISKLKRKSQESLRRMFKKLNLLPLQKSVYLSPYPCDREVEFLREYFDVSEEVIYIRADKIENEEYYKRYFGL